MRTEGGDDKQDDEAPDESKPTPFEKFKNKIQNKQKYIINSKILAETFQKEADIINTNLSEIVLFTPFSIANKKI